MHNCRKYPKPVATPKTIGLWLCSALFYSNAAYGFTVNHAALTPDETGYTLTANIRFQLNEETRQALEHGVALRIDIEIEARQLRLWLWDRVLRTEFLKRRLEYHPLSEQYLVTDLNAGIKRHFQTLPHALAFLGTIKNYPAFGRISRVEGARYTARIRARLHTESLPTPLKLIAYTSADWRLSSPWFTWAITP